MSIVFFIAGMGLGLFVSFEVDEYKEAKMEFLEEAAGIEPPDGFYLQRDPSGRVWLIGPASCEQVF